jgi:DNA polymerase III alpha subunit
VASSPSAPLDFSLGAREEEEVHFIGPATTSSGQWGDVDVDGDSVDGVAMDDDLDGARRELDTLTGIFGQDNVYLELQDAGIDGQRRINQHLATLAKETGRSMVATGDVHYICHQDAESHEALLAIQTRDVLSNPNRFKFDTQEFFIKSGEEMLRALPDYPESLQTTLEIAERCSDLKLPLGDLKLPVFPVPTGETDDVYLENLCREGLDRRYGPGNWPAEAEDRLRFELDTIKEMGFSSYFLIVWDYIKWSRENGVAVGPGRGSAAGSLVAFSLRITDLDPLEHGLLFERVHSGPENSFSVSLLVPEASTQKHLEILSEIAEMLSDSGLREQLKQSQDAVQLHQLITNWRSVQTV